MEFCDYIFKKGKKQGNKCNRIAIYNNLCNQHLLPFIKKCKHIEINNDQSSKFPPFSVTLKQLQFICDKWDNRKKITIKLEKLLPFSQSKTQTIHYTNNFSPHMVQINGLPFLVPKVQDTIKYKDKQEINVPQQFDRRWVLGKNLGKGGFGSVYECFDIHDYSKELAIKLEHQTSKGLFCEIQFYNHIEMKYSSLKIIPKKYAHGIYHGIRYIVIEKLYKFKFNINRISEIIKGLEIFSKLNRTHGDIKFSNIMQRKNQELVFIDFGLCWNISEFPNWKYISGTLVYMSLNAHYGIASYKNDLESFMYSFLEIFHELPWGNQNINNIRKIILMKKDFILKLKIQDHKTMTDFYLLKFPRIYNFIMKIIDISKYEYPNYKLIKF